MTFQLQSSINKSVFESRGPTFLYPGVCATKKDLKSSVFAGLGWQGGPSHSAEEPQLLALTPSEALDNHSPTLRSSEPARTSRVNPVQSPPDHRDLLAEDPLHEFSLAEINPNPFSLNLPSQDLEAMDDGPSPYSETLGSYGSSLFDENMAAEGGLPSPLNQLMEESAILDEIRLLDLALEEGFSPEMAARLDEEGYLQRQASQQEPAAGDSSPVLDAEDLDQTRTYHQGERSERVDGLPFCDTSGTSCQVCIRVVGVYVWKPRNP